MIKTIHGDLMEAKETYIVHQVNCYGAMGRGVAMNSFNHLSFPP